MKQIRSAFLWAFFLFYAFNFLIFAIIVTYLFPIEKYNPWLQFLFRLFLKISGIKVEVKGLDNINKNKVYLFMANHVSIFDIALFAGYIPNVFRGIEAERQFEWPIYGYAIKRLGNIPINRKSPTIAMKSINKAVEKIKNGLSILILPEGHRTLTGEMKPFKKLPFLIAKNCEKELVPIGISGLYSLKKKGSWLITPGKVQINFGKPIGIEEINELSIDELKVITKEKIEKLIDYK